MVALLAVVANGSPGCTAGDDCLGYTVLAEKHDEDPPVQNPLGKLI